MKTFTDNSDRTWTIHVHVESIKRVRSLCNVDLLKVVEGTLLMELANDPILLCEVLYALCHEEAKAKNVSDVDFGKAMAGDAIERATEALLREIFDFFPPAKRDVLLKLEEKHRQMQQKMVEVATKRLESPECMKKIESLLETSGN